MPTQKESVAMSTEPLLFEQTDHIATISINRPDSRNALAGDEMFSAFEQVVERLNNDMSIRAAILTGVGKAFCAGGDVKEMRSRVGMFAGTQPEIQQRYRSGIQRIPRALARLDVPIIAAVNGPAIGAGLDLACMCDIRISAPKAIFAESFVKVGIISGDGGAWFLPRTIGSSWARELAFTGDTIEAEQALKIGLISRIAPEGGLLDEARALAERIAVNAPQVLRWTKRLLREGASASLDNILELGSGMQAMAHHTNDHAEALEAFFERRPAVFKGN
jgi:enoyl-CoA hydratase/carnithine racemase